MIGIVLRGPTGVGKTSVARALLALLEQLADQFVNLDNGWCDEEYRCTRIPERYPDLRGRREPVLVIELANGEPVRHIIEFFRRSAPVEPGFWQRHPGPGATVNPEEWVRLLQSEGRAVRSFLLTAEWSTISARKNNAPNLQQWHGLYKEPEWITFAARADIPEERIATDTATLTDIATHILQTLKLEN